MSQERRRRVAGTEDRIESRHPRCAYRQCEAALTPSQVADGWTTCSEECHYELLMDRFNTDDEEPTEEEDV